MAAIPLNKFRTITHTLTTSSVGIYTCPPGVASLVVFANVANVGSGTSTVSFSAFHSRGAVDTPIIQKGQIPNQDSMSIICLLYTSPSPRDGLLSRMPSSA